MFRRIEPPTRAQSQVLVGVILAGALGLLAGGRGGPVGTLAWLCLAAPACGALAGAHGLRLWPYGLGIPGAWFLFLVWADLAADQDLPTPVWGAFVLGGFFTLGLAAGRLFPERAWALAGLLLLAMLTASALCVQAGLGRRSWAADHPGVARALVEVSPLVIATESCGLEWTHAQPQMYSLAGVEWFQRRPYRGPLAGTTLLLVGCVSALVASRRGAPR